MTRKADGMTTRHAIPKRCDLPAWRDYPNGYRVCVLHATDAVAETVYPGTIGPCDYPMDGLGAARYEPLTPQETTP